MSDALALREHRQLLIAALVLVALALGQLAVDAAPARHDQDLAAGAEDVLGDRRLDARVLELGVRVEDGEEAARDEVVDAAVVVAHLLELVLGVRRDDRVVVADLLVVDDAAERQQVEPGDVRGGRRVLGVAPDLRRGRLQLGNLVARAGSATRCAGR